MSDASDVGTGPLPCRRRLRRGTLLLGCVAPVMAGVALAQEAAGPAAAAPGAPEAAPTEELSQIVVSSTRIVRDGYQAPTPTTVLGSDDILKAAQPNIFNYVNELPSLGNSASTETGNTGISAGTGGLSLLNLRNLGTNRTLVLLDGRRVVGSALTGVVDVSVLPQDLIQRVDVVTGGTSAAWGSDAIAGVVNFVLNRDFTGIKTDVQTGLSTYGDDRQDRLAFTAGSGFADGKGHVLLSLEGADQAGIRGTPRPWYNGTKLVQFAASQTPAGSPEYLTLSHVGSDLMVPGGLITSGPLKGTAFGPGGTPYTFQYGQGIYNGLLGDPEMQGGQWKTSDIGSYSNLDDKMRRKTAYTRLSYDVADDINVWGEFAYSDVFTNYGATTNYKNGTLTMHCDNAYLPASISAACAADGISTFTYGTTDNDLGIQDLDNDRMLRRGAFGIDGKTAALGTQWTWNANIGRGVNEIDNYVNNESITPYFNLAIDAVVNPANGQIVCRSSLTSPTNGCVPLDIFGTGVASQAARNYVTGQAHLHLRMQEDTAGFSVSGDPLTDWAGAISTAFGYEYRKEAVDGTADCLSDSNCGGNPLLNAIGNNYMSGNFHPTIGEYHVNEAFVETVVPLTQDLPFAKATNLDAAVRATDYSTSGYVTTWKFGLNYSPVDDIRFRATRSRDIRAPNLQDLFLPAQTQFQSVIDDFPPHAGQSEQISRPLTGNVNLKPEVASQTGVGVVFSPRWIEGFNASIDYFDININGVITTLTNQQEMDLCYAGDSALCSLIKRDPVTGLVTSLTVQAQNLAQLSTRGYDIEASYRAPLHDLLPFAAGDLTLRALGTRTLTNKLTTGIVGSVPQEFAGENSDGIPKWKTMTSQAWDIGKYSVLVAERYISAGVINTNYIQCTSNCPAPTINHPTINDNHIAGAIYVDLSGSYRVYESEAGNFGELYFRIDNLLNREPPAAAQYGSNPFTYAGVNPALYDVVGRFFRMGFRMQFK